MIAKDLGKRIQLIAEPIARALSLELIEVVCQGKGAGTVIRVILDKDGGVNIRDCEQFHQSLSRALDVDDPVPYSYRLEVSSPGLDRPLKNRKDYQRVMGKILQITIHDALLGQRQVVGQLSALTDSGVTLMVRSGKQQNINAVEFPWDSIKGAKQWVEF